MSRPGCAVIGGSDSTEIEFSEISSVELIVVDGGRGVVESRVVDSDVVDIVVGTRCCVNDVV